MLSLLKYDPKAPWMQRAISHIMLLRATSYNKCYHTPHVGIIPVNLIVFCFWHSGVLLFVVRYLNHKRQKEVCSEHQWVNEAQWEDDTVVSSSARRVHSLIHGYCVPVKYRLRQVNTIISAGNTGIAVRDAYPMQGGLFITPEDSWVFPVGLQSILYVFYKQCV